MCGHGPSLSMLFLWMKIHLEFGKSCREHFPCNAEIFGNSIYFIDKKKSRNICRASWAGSIAF